MINNILDLKNRTFAESNTLKSLILQSNYEKSRFDMDGMILHDYQIANSISLNSILSNFIVNISNSYTMNYATNALSYFDIVGDFESVQRLDDNIKMFLYASDGVGSFYSKGLKLTKKELVNVPGTVKFELVDSIWYNLVYEQIINNVDDESSANGEILEKVIQYNQLFISKEMTDKMNIKNIFGDLDIEPFQDIQVKFGDQEYSSVNDFIKKKAIENNGRQTINSITVNIFRGNVFTFDGLRCSKYILCTTSGLYGLEFEFTNGVVTQFIMHDFSEMMKNMMDSNYEFVDCQFISIDESSTMVVVCIDSNGEYHYLYMNDESFDEVYGFNVIDKLETNGVPFPVSSAISKVEYIKSLGTQDIVMTDYGFWGIEPNMTNDITYSYRGMKDYEDGIEFKNSRTDKIVLPTMNVGETDVVVEYDRVWKLSGDKYVNGNISYPKSIFSSNVESKYSGSGDDFAIYWGSDDKGRILIPFDDVKVFEQALFSEPRLSEIFIDYVYEQVTHPEKGEYYLRRNYSKFASTVNQSLSDSRVDDLRYQMDDDLYPDKLNSILDLVNASDSDSNKLTRYCSKLNEILSNGSTIKGLIDVDALKRRMSEDFKDNIYKNNGYFNQFVNYAVDQLVEKFPILSYFKKSLTSGISDKLNGDFGTSVEVDDDVFNRIVQSIVDYIRNIVQASLVIGGYQDNGEVDNSRYPGIDSYLTLRDKMDVKKVNILGLFSSNVIKNEISNIVKTSKFFDGSFNTYFDSMNHKDDEDLFKIVDDNGFAAKSGLVDENGMLKIDWSDIKDWMFSDKMNEESILKAFIRTMFYRPIYFDSTGYSTKFSSDQKKYKCEVNRFYVNHNRELTELHLDGDKVLPTESGLSDSHITNIEYSILTNRLSYRIHSDEIEVVDDKFTYNGIEYYVIRNAGDGTNTATSVYFNEYMNIDSVIEDLVFVQDGKFTIGGVDYELVVDEQTNKATVLKIDRFQNFPDNQFKQELVDDRFEVGGIFYVLEKDDNNGYRFVRSSNGKDYDLIRVLLDNGKGRHGDIEFDFKSDDKLVIVKYYQMNVIDKVASEWCEYDDVEVVIDQNRPFEWYLANAVADMYRNNPTQREKIISLEGTMFSGSLDSDAKIEFINDIQGGYALTFANIIVPTLDGSSQKTYDYGVLIGGQSSSFDSSKVKLDSNVATIVKDTSKPVNNLNSVTVDVEEWNRGTGIIDLTNNANIELEDDQKNIRISLDYADDSFEVTLTQKDNTISDIQYQVYHNGKYMYDAICLTSGDVHFVINQNRYIYNTKTKRISVIKHSTMKCRILDFSTKYDYDTLVDQMFLNIKEYMFNKTVFSILNATGYDESIDLNSVNLNNYNELFSDYESLSEYSLITGKNQGDAEYQKYDVMFKTISGELDYSDNVSGNIYDSVLRTIHDVFGENEVLTLVDKPSILVNRIDEQDVFSYDIYFDLNLRSSKNVIDKTHEGRFIVLNAIVKDVHCHIDITPKFNGQSNPMTYDVAYSIVNTNNSVATCDQISYVKDGKIRQKSISPITTTFALNGFVRNYSNQSMADLDDNDTFASRISEIFTESEIKQILIAVNNSIPNDTSIQVEYNEVKNSNSPDGVWKFDEPLPENASSSSLGRAIIGGLQYFVKQENDGILKLSPQYGGEEFTIKKIQANTGEFVNHDGEYIEKKEDKWCIIGDSVETRDNLNSIFTVKTLKNYVKIKIDETEQVIEVPIKCLAYDNPNLFKYDGNVKMEGETFHVVDIGQETKTTSIGENLVEDSFFHRQIKLSEIVGGEYSFTLDDIKGEVLDDNGQNIWSGVPGKVDIKLSNIDTEKIEESEIHSVVESKNDCLEVTQIPKNISPDDVEAVQMSTMSIYHVIEVTEIQAQMDDVDLESEEEEQTITLTFKLKVEIKPRLIGAIPTSIDEDYYSYGLYVGHDGTIKNAMLSYDCSQSMSGDLPYGMLQYSPELTTTKSLDQIELKTIYVEFNEIGISSYGYNCPYTLTVLPYDGVRQNEWDIFDRYYTSVDSIMSTHIEIDASKSFPDGSFIMNLNNTTNTIHAFPYDYTKFEFDVTNYMNKLVDEHILNSMKADDGYFKQRLIQVKQFLLKVDSELKMEIDKSDVLSMCIFEYDIELGFSRFENSWESGLLTGTEYQNELIQFNNHLKSEFKSDHMIVGFNSPSSKDYVHILIGDNSDVHNVKQELINDMYSSLTNSDNTIIDEIFGDDANEVKYINALEIGVDGELKGVYVFDEHCHIFYEKHDTVNWIRFSIYHKSLQESLENREQKWESMSKNLRYEIDNDFWFKFANRNHMSDSSIMGDAFMIGCIDGNGNKMTYMSWNGLYAYSHNGEEIKDIAYEKNFDRVYVLFKNDDRIYAYDDLNSISDHYGRVILTRTRANMVIETFHSVSINKPSDASVDTIYIDYYDSDNGGHKWSMRLYGMMNGKHDCEIWNPCTGRFKQYNTIMFGDTLFTNNQLNFQNISKNKEMFDILDVNEVDGCYYGLFKDNTKSTEHEEIFTVFKTVDTTLNPDGVIKRLPYEIVCPKMFRSSDELYSLWVVVRVPNGYEVDENGNQVVKYKIQLQEISVPENSSIYKHRTIDVQDIIGDDYMQINDIFMDGFKVQRNGSKLFVLTNNGFYEISYENDIKPISIDTLDNFKQILGIELTSSILKKHMDEYHNDHEHEYFEVIKNKINQFDPDFTVFNLIPTEFGHTQDVGVVPNEKVDDTDESSDHRGDSVVVSTDILQSGGMIVDADTNPGFITAAISNPATMYDDDTIFIKSQRNPSIEGTEFYDYIYDENGNELMDLYAIPFIYRLNSNNTYDLYINIPTTRTKYLNRIAGTLNSDLTSQVLADDYMDRVNFMEEALPNNLDESTTKLRIYIDRKFISVGNVELVEISGNSIPLQIYRGEQENYGLYDSIALEGRWNGEVEEILEPSKDINKVMLEFEVYGTDSQSIHITGKTLINSFLDDNKYKFD